ncbi:hypothetical protein A5692_11935 [Mycobacterium sp. E342]|uniref:Uncharacterized protein n=1 Tax=Mycobacterium paraseoulense TaxID=590652 RepID=A0A1X0IG19_9MYCO|nr:hypothetical protein A9X04_15205 [Mycobacterium sp. E3247]OBH35315.1 hypothetical protein A5692_11935 [Mycobacterium sp. E342]ORB45458.1 hypothetical protein BST39_04390 [Mycobacterium paraseoulense]
MISRAAATICSSVSAGGLLRAADRRASAVDRLFSAIAGSDPPVTSVQILTSPRLADEELDKAVTGTTR